jgi:hypothetical protein
MMPQRMGLLLSPDPNAGREDGEERSSAVQRSIVTRGLRLMNEKMKQFVPDFQSLPLNTQFNMDPRQK